MITAERDEGAWTAGVGRRTLLASSLALAGASMVPLLARASVPDGLSRLVRAYPTQLSHAEDNALVWRDGTRMTWSYMIAGRTFAQKLEDPNLCDQLSIPYPKGPVAAPPPPDCDPGRIRYRPFFEKMYGRDAAEVRRNLVKVRWAPAGRSFAMSRVNGIDVLLAEIGEEIAALPDAVARFARNPAGGFNDRNVAGTARRSAHAFGIAFDIDSRLSRYWRWDRPPHWRNDVPDALVEVFERRRFIWGGKWFHYDTMHFEYRPELF